ncbi:MAG: hypothetical protein Q9195_007403 [Heterodermia aff. obscurata]
MSNPHKSPTLLDLPVEIVLYILQAADSFSDLKSLILTAPSFNNVWKAYTASISSGVLARNIEGFAQVLKLEETVHPKLAAGFEPAIERIKRITSAACLAECAYEGYVFNYSRNTRYKNLFVCCDSGQEKFCLRDPESRRSFKRSFYWLWLLVITSESKPLVLHQPLDPFPLRRTDVLSLCEILWWIVAVYENPPQLSIFRKAYRIYNVEERVRCPHNRRWELCCITLWKAPRFQQTRREYWSLDLGISVPEPSLGGRRPRLASLAKAREAQSLIYQFQNLRKIPRTLEDESQAERKALSEH